MHLSHMGNFHLINSSSQPFIQRPVGTRKEHQEPSGTWGEHGCRGPGIEPSGTGESMVAVVQVLLPGTMGAVITLVILLQGGTGAGLGGRAAGVEGVVGGSGGWAGAAGA